MKYRVIKPFGSRNGLKIYQPGEIVDFPKGSNRVEKLLGCGHIVKFRSDIKLPTDIRNMLQLWVDCNENPIKEIGIFKSSFFTTGPKDSDGFYCYTFYGYVDSIYENRAAGEITLRLKAPLAFNYEDCKDYSLEELGLKEKNENSKRII